MTREQQKTKVSAWSGFSKSSSWLVDNCLLAVGSYGLSSAPMHGKRFLFSSHKATNATELGLYHYDFI